VGKCRWSNHLWATVPLVLEALLLVHLVVREALLLVHSVAMFVLAALQVCPVAILAPGVPKRQLAMYRTTIMLK